MSQSTDESKPLVLSYVGLRRAIGVIGLALPIVPALGRMFAAGLAALKGLLKASTYRNRTIPDALARCAPAPANDPMAYSNCLLGKIIPPSASQTKRT